MGAGIDTRFTSGAGSTTGFVKSVNGQNPDGSGAVTLTPAEVGALAEANNLSDVQSAATSRTNLGLGSAATHAASELVPTGGTTGQVLAKNSNTNFDTKWENAPTPSATTLKSPLMNAPYSGNGNTVGGNTWVEFYNVPLHMSLTHITIAGTGGTGNFTVNVFDATGTTLIASTAATAVVSGARQDIAFTGAPIDLPAGTYIVTISGTGTATVGFVGSIEFGYKTGSSTPPTAPITVPSAVSAFSGASTGVNFGLW